MAKPKKKAVKKAVKKVVKKAAPKSVVHAPTPAPKNELGIQLLHDRVLIKPKDVESTTASGIIIPDTVKKEKLMTGVVVAIGTGRFNDSGELIPMLVREGETVYFNRGWDEDGSKFSWHGEDYFLVSEGDIKAIIG